jgi:hypothetical protein
MTTTEPKKLTPFDFLDAIQVTGKILITDEDSEKQYIPFIINKGLSFGADTVIYANEMNSRPHIPREFQNLFLINNIVKRKRYNKWIKAELSNELELVKRYYGYSTEKAKQALSILNQDQLNTIKQKLEKGGRK